MNTLYHYDALFTFPPLCEAQQRSILRAFQDAGLSVELTDTSLEFELDGRDTNRRVIECFRLVAKELKSACGEMRCEIDDENMDPSFEFLTIKEDRIWRETGEIVRSGPPQPL